MSLFNNAIYLDDIPKEEWKNYIGNGYRSCCYTTDQDRHGRIILFGFDKAGNSKTFICPWESHVSYNVKYQTDKKDIYGHYVATKYFGSKYLRDKYVEEAVGLNIVESLNPEEEFMHFMFDDVVLNDDFNQQKMRIFSLDIETEMSDTFMPPSRAENRINMLTIYDSETEKFYTWSLKHADVEFHDFEEKVEWFDLKDEISKKYTLEKDKIWYEDLKHNKIDLDKIDVDDYITKKKIVLRMTHNELKDMPKSKFVFVEFNDDEEDLLNSFIDWFEDNRPDVVYGWNTKAYDIPYIFRRIENVLGKKAACRLSPIGRYWIKDVNHDNKRADVSAEIEVNIPGLFNADGLILYRDKFGIAGGTLDGGFGLSNVGEHEELGRKIEYDGSLKDLYTKDYQKFYEYNIRDVSLCKKIDDKCKMVALARNITSYGLSDYNKIYGTIRYLTQSLVSFATTEYGCAMTSYLKEKKVFDKYEGAFVFPVAPGIYIDGIAVVDYASLYPSCTRACNISPETYVGKLLIVYQDELGKECPINEINEPMFNIYNDDVVNNPRIKRYILKLPNGRKQDITIEKVKELVNTKCIYTPNNTLFLRHEVKFGIVAKWCEHFYMMRKATKKKELDCFHILQDPSIKLSDKEHFELETKEQNYHSKQIALKLMINSIYGCMGNNNSAIADPNLAQSITRTGKFCNIEASKYALKYFKDKYGISNDYNATIYGDTDSQFLNIECISKQLVENYGLERHISEWPQERRQELWDITKSFVHKDLTPYVRKLVHSYCKSNQQDALSYDLEYMADVGIFEGKKHYAIHKIFDEGDAVDKTKYAGIELKKAQVPKQMKRYLADIYDGAMMKHWSSLDYEKYICELYDRFKDFSIDEISFWKGYSTERQAVGFLEMEVGTTGIAKACTYYNQLIQKLGLGKKYEEIRVGDKVRFCYIDKNNDYCINQIAYKPDQWPKEFAKLFKPDYRTMFNKVILDPLKKFRIACQFSEIDPSRQVQFDIFTL